MDGVITMRSSCPRLSALIVASAALAISPLRAEAQADVAPESAAESLAAPEAYTFDAGAAEQHRALRFTDEEARVKVRRLRIAGWTLLGVGVLLVPAFVLDQWYSNDGFGPFVLRAGFVYGVGWLAGLIGGTTMLARARGIDRRHPRARDASSATTERHVDFNVSLGGAALSLRF
jgi:hypothetical protein